MPLQNFYSPKSNQNDSSSELCVGMAIQQHKARFYQVGAQIFKDAKVGDVIVLGRSTHYNYEHMHYCKSL